MKTLPQFLAEDAKVTIKPTPSYTGTMDVFRDGMKVANFWFLRDKRDDGIKVSVKCTGELTDIASGKKTRLDHFVWMDDVRKYIKDIYK